MRALGPPRARTHALTIGEVLVALTLLALVLLPVIVGFSQALVSSSESAISAAAASIVRDKVEGLKMLPFAVVESQPRQTRDLKPGDSFFEVEVTVQTLRPDDSAQAGLKKVEVTVYRTGGHRPVAVATTYLAPLGV